MIRRLILLFSIGMVVLVFLGAEYWRVMPLPWYWFWCNQFREELISFFESPKSQWAIAIGVAGGLLLINYCRWRLAKRTNPDSELTGRMKILAWFSIRELLLLSLVGWGTLNYALNYQKSAVTTDFSVFLSTLTLGQLIAFLDMWLRSDHPQINDLPRIIIVIFIFLLSAAALFHPEMGITFQYQGNRRWNGPWMNPNTYGVLMGVGVTLAMGMLCSTLTPYAGKQKAFYESSFRNRLRKGLPLLLGLLTGIMFFALVKSYSRGAGLGTLLGLIYLGNVQWKFSKARPGWMRWLFHHSASLGLIALCLTTLVFWNFRHTEKWAIRRVFSAANINDFSGMNRIVAYRGALQMMADKPLTGFGWNEPENTYNDWYIPPQLVEGRAITLNDYFTLGMTLGLPALVCFIIFINFSIKSAEGGIDQRTSQNGNNHLHPASTGSLLPRIEIDWSRVTCRAAVMVILVGIWFERGLFQLALATPFWIFLEISASAKIQPQHIRLKPLQSRS